MCQRTVSEIIKQKEKIMNILIVDDNATNRMVLDAFLDNYMESNPKITFEVDQAKDGLEAVKKAKKNSYNMIFMDINMPNMDGVEASRLIRLEDKKVMIIAVSAAEDSKKRSEILDNGAEDYISKPVDADIFNLRLKNYISLCESRNKESVSAKVVNLYTNKVYSRHTMFMLDSEDSVAEFWEFFLHNARKKSDHLSDVIRVVVAIVDKQMGIENSNRIYIEESEDMQYFTLVNIDVLPLKVVELLLKKNIVADGYKLTDKKISFELIKSKQYEDEKQEEVIVQQPKDITPIVEKNISSEFDYSSARLQVFDYLDIDDLCDLEEYSESLNSMMLLVGGGSLEKNDVFEMCGYLNQISALLSPYNEIYAISNALGELSASLSTYVEVFTVNASTLGPMCSAFSNDLMAWVKQSFHTGAPSIDFMNDTIAVNTKTIIAMLKMDEVPPASDDDFDDIFDF